MERRRIVEVKKCNLFVVVVVVVVILHIKTWNRIGNCTLLNRRTDDRSLGTGVPRNEVFRNVEYLRLVVSVLWNECPFWTTSGK